MLKFKIFNLNSELLTQEFKNLKLNSEPLNFSSELQRMVHLPQPQELMPAKETSHHPNTLSHPHPDTEPHHNNPAPTVHQVNPLTDQPLVLELQALPPPPAPTNQVLEQEADPHTKPAAPPKEPLEALEPPQEPTALDQELVFQDQALDTELPFQAQEPEPLLPLAVKVPQPPPAAHQPTDQAQEPEPPLA